MHTEAQRMVYAITRLKGIMEASRSVADRAALRLAIEHIEARLTDMQGRGDAKAG